MGRDRSSIDSGSRSRDCLVRYYKGCITLKGISLIDDNRNPFMDLLNNYSIYSNAPILSMQQPLLISSSILSVSMNAARHNLSLRSPHVLRLPLTPSRSYGTCFANLFQWTIPSPLDKLIIAHCFNFVNIQITKIIKFLRSLRSRPAPANATMTRRHKLMYLPYRFIRSLKL